MRRPSTATSPEDAHGPGLVAVATLVLWCVCLAVGITGFFLHMAGPVTPAQPLPIEAELLNVQTIAARPQADASPPAAAARAAESPQPPEPPPVTPPAVPPEFVEPVNFVPHRSARHFATTATAPATTPVNSVIQLTFGEGDGQQPAPEYPDEAVIAEEEGTVVVRLEVNEEGRVIEASASSPCKWPVLNSAAVRAVRDTWRFRRGPRRVYEVSIEFHLNKHEVP